MITLEDTPLDPVKLVVRRRLEDDRGYFERLFSADELSPALGGRSIAAVNRTRTTTRGTVRGMHFQQPPHAELKIVSCLRGTVFDVAVDLRAGSPTFLRWFGQELTADKGIALLIPEGFAHGFQSLTDDCELLYLHTARFAPDAEGGVNAEDPRLDISWPVEITVRSERDLAHPLLADDFEGLVL